MRLGTLRAICDGVPDDAMLYINLSPGEMHRPDVRVTAIFIGHEHPELLDDSVGEPRVVVVLS